MSNPRYQNGNLRRKYRARFKAMGAPCGICGGYFGPIHYDEPSDAKHPLSFVIDEKIPVSKAVHYGYESRGAAAKDWQNLQAAHWCCNAAKGAKVGFRFDKYVRGSQMQKRSQTLAHKRDGGNSAESATQNAKIFGPVAMDGDW